MILYGILLLVIFQVIGDCLYQSLPFKLPASVWGMVLLTCFLAWRKQPASPETEKPGLFLIRYMALLFVPAGVGVMKHLDLLQRSCLPVTIGLIGSTVLCIAVTGGLMQRVCKHGK